MPLYDIEHSYPLTLQQKTDLAERITKLHATAFSTPSIFVQVKYYRQDVTANNHFVAGKPEENASNRIMAYVRSGPSRKKEHFDKLGEDIQNAWYIVLGEQAENSEDKEQQKTIDNRKTGQKEKDAMELVSITFVTGIIVREKGYVIPEAGSEGEWFKQNREDFQKKADLGYGAFKDMLEEVEQREDLAAWRS